MVVFARVGETSVLDCSPLTEIASVQHLGNAPTDRDSTHEHSIKSAYSLLYTDTLQLSTKQDGPHGGRVHRLQARDHASCAQLAAQLQALALAASPPQARRSPFQQSRHYVRRLYESFACQAIVALMAVTVPSPPNRALRHPPPPPPASPPP